MDFDKAFEQPNKPLQQNSSVPTCPSCNKLLLQSRVCSNSCGTYMCDCGHTFFVKFYLRFPGHNPLCGM